MSKLKNVKHDQRYFRFIHTETIERLFKRHSDYGNFGNFQGWPITLHWINLKTD